MNLLRTKKQGCWLALCAMMVQLTFSFGHINGAQHHVEGPFLSAAKSLFAHVPVDHYQSRHHNHHNHHKHNDHEDEDEEDNCPTCWTISVSGSLVLPVIETVSWYSRSITIPRARNNTAFVSASLILPYQVRAPPFVSIG